MDELSYREALPEFFVRNHTGEIFYIKYNDIYILTLIIHNDNILIHYIRSAYINNGISRERRYGREQRV